MTFAITFPSALLFWISFSREISYDRYSVAKRRLVSLPKAFAFHRVEKEAALLARDCLKLTTPITILSPEANSRYETQFLKVLKRPNAMPANSFVELMEYREYFQARGLRVLIATPELCFLEAARVLDFNQLMVLGMELCGNYMWDGSSEFGQRRRVSVASAASIWDFLSNASGYYGHRQAMKAARYLLDHSNSPRESMLAILGRLPLSRGGYALKVPELNRRLLMSSEGAALLNGRACYGDIVWENEKIVVEYDSDLAHLSSVQHQIDKARANAIHASGYRLISITKQNTATRHNLDQMFSLIRRELGQASVQQELDKYQNRRQVLIRTINTFNSRDYFANVIAGAIG